MTPISDKQTRNAIRVWMRQVLEEKGWNASEWARRAGTSGTNITRVLGPTSDIVPSAATIAKLARAAGSQPNLGVFERQSARMLPVRFWGRWMMETGAQVLAPVATSDQAYAVKVESDAMSLAGIFPGDTVICEPAAMAIDGKIVIGDGPEGPVIGRVMRPWLLPQSAGRHTPLPLEQISIVAVCVSVIRTL